MPNDRFPLETGPRLPSSRAGYTLIAPMARRKKRRLELLEKLTARCNAVCIGDSLKALKALKLQCTVYRFNDPWAAIKTQLKDLLQIVRAARIFLLDNVITLMECSLANNFKSFDHFVPRNFDCSATNFLFRMATFMRSDKTTKTIKTSTTTETRFRAR